MKNCYGRIWHHPAKQHHQPCTWRMVLGCVVYGIAVVYGFGARRVGAVDEAYCRAECDGKGNGRGKRVKSQVHLKNTQAHTSFQSFPFSFFLSLALALCLTLEHRQVFHFRQFSVSQSDCAMKVIHTHMHVHTLNTYTYIHVHKKILSLTSKHKQHTQTTHKHTNTNTHTHSLSLPHAFVKRTRVKKHHPSHQDFHINPPPLFSSSQVGTDSMLLGSWVEAEGSTESGGRGG